MFTYFFISFVLSQNHWRLLSSISPAKPNKDLFGRSVSICSSNQRIVIGAEWASPEGSTERTGALFVYDYDFRDHIWTEKQKIFPIDQTNNNNIHVLSLGSTVEISSDCTTIVSGAPYSNVQGINETGAVLIFKYDTKSNSFKQDYIGSPIEPIVGGGFGRIISISSDAQYYAASNYNKFSESSLKFEGQIEIHSNTFNRSTQNFRWEKAVLDPPTTILNGSRYRFGNNIQFLDSSTLIASADDSLDKSTSGIYIFKKYFNATAGKVLWRLVSDGINASSVGYTNIGEAFSMPTTMQDFIALTATNLTNCGIIFLARNDVTDLWERLYTVDLPAGATVNRLYFCGENQLAVIGTLKSTNSKSLSNSKRTMFSKNSMNSTNFAGLEKGIDSTSLVENSLFLLKKINGKFMLYDTILEPEEDKKNPEKHLNFLSSFAWDQKFCFRFLVGSMSKTGGNGEGHVPFEFGKTYVYQTNDFGIMNISKHYSFLPAILIGLFSSLLFLIVVSVIVFYVIKFRKRRSARNAHLNDPINL